MKQKSLMKLANKIAELEHIIQTSKDKKEVAKAQDAITTLAMSVPLGLKDMVALDEMIQEIYEKKYSNS
mgnify:CR=1 FL=1